LEKQLQLNSVDLVSLLGVNDVHLQLIEDRFDATIIVRGDMVTVRGDPEEVEQVERIFRELIYILNKNWTLTSEDVNTVLDLVALDRAEEMQKVGKTP